MSDKNNINWPDFDEYLHQGEPEKREKASNWQTAIGLQAVDGLTPSDYLIEVARKNIEGEISLDEVDTLIKSYYQSKDSRTSSPDDKEEADKASKNINRILSVRTLDFSTNGLVSLHRRIFDGVFKFAGKIRDYDISKHEWVLRGASVSYLNYQDLRTAVDYEIQKEKNFDYRDLSMEDVVRHISHFIADLWQIHPFCEGNTRTTSVFTIQYLRSIGFDVDNEPFARNSWYFRNALVRANYRNVQKGIDYTFDFLEAFFRNLLMGEDNELKNRYLVIDAPEELNAVAISSTHQVPIKLPSSTPQVNPDIVSLVIQLGKEQMNVRDLMKTVGLKDRVNFMTNYLTPALEQGFIVRLYPDNPRHPRQKYMLSVKGLTLYNKISKGQIAVQHGCTDSL